MAPDWASPPNSLFFQNSPSRWMKLPLLHSLFTSSSQSLLCSKNVLCSTFVITGRLRQHSHYLRALTKSTPCSVFICLAHNSSIRCSWSLPSSFSPHVPMFLFSPAFLSHLPSPAPAPLPDRYMMVLGTLTYVLLFLLLFSATFSLSPGKLIQSHKCLCLIADFLLLITSRPITIVTSLWMSHNVVIFTRGSLPDFCVLVTIPSPLALQANKPETSESLWTLPTSHHPPIPLHVQHLITKFLPFYLLNSSQIHPTSPHLHCNCLSLDSPVSESDF